MTATDRWFPRIVLIVGTVLCSTASAETWEHADLRMGANPAPERLDLIAGDVAMFTSEKGGKKLRTWSVWCASAKGTETSRDWSPGESTRTPVANRIPRLVPSNMDAWVVPKPETWWSKWGALAVGALAVNLLAGLFCWAFIRELSQRRPLRGSDRGDGKKT